MQIYAISPRQDGRNWTILCASVPVMCGEGDVLERHVSARRLRRRLAYWTQRYGGGE